jgi:DNA-binding response OmpR family regulator
MKDENYKVIVVDDDATARLLLESVLSKCYAFEAFESGEACLEQVSRYGFPDLFLLDVGLPGLNGYDLSRKIKELPDGKHVPIMFVSGHDNLEDVLAGYDAGGQDYIVKPFDVLELVNKIENVRRIEREQKALQEQALASEALVTMLMGSLDENSVLIKFLRTLNECGDHTDIANAMQRVLDALRLEGAVQIRMRNLEKTFSKAGENWPLEVAVIKHIRTLDTIFQFKQRAAYNFEHITLLITNMPIQDAELCGRLRDSLAIVAESANDKLKALQSYQDQATMRGQIHDVLQSIDETVLQYSKRYDQARYEGSEFMLLFLDDLMKAFAHLALSDRQEEIIMEMIRDRCNRLIDLYDIAGKTQETLSTLSQKLENVLAATTPGKIQS